MNLHLINTLNTTVNAMCDVVSEETALKIQYAMADFEIDIADAELDGNGPVNAIDLLNSFYMHLDGNESFTCWGDEWTKFHPIITHMKEEFYEGNYPNIFRPIGDETKWPVKFEWIK